MPFSTRNSMIACWFGCFIVVVITKKLNIYHERCLRFIHSPEIVRYIFAQTTQHYNFRQNRDFRIRSVKPVYHGSKSISYLGPEIWEIVPAKIKEINSHNSFKIEIRKWIPQSCEFANNILAVLVLLQLYKYNNIFFCTYIYFFRVRFRDLYFWFLSFEFHLCMVHLDQHIIPSMI